MGDIKSILFVSILQNEIGSIQKISDTLSQTLKQIYQRRPYSKIKNSRLFHLQGVGCKIVNCVQVTKNRKHD